MTHPHDAALKGLQLLDLVLKLQDARLGCAWVVVVVVGVSPNERAHKFVSKSVSWSGGPFSTILVQDLSV
jgi:hypothetical protein